MALIEEKQHHLTPQTSYSHNVNSSHSSHISYQQPICTQVSEAILAQGIDDLTK
jgi:hypothetical protein